MVKRNQESQHIKADILIVEDHQAVRESIKDWLSINFPHCRFFEAASGEEAVKVALEKNPRLVLMDIELPGIDGLETTRKLKDLKPELQILILTIHEDKRYSEEAARIGANGFLPKSRMYQKLVPLMTTLLSQKTKEGKA